MGFPRAGCLAITAEVPPAPESLCATKDIPLSADFVVKVGKEIGGGRCGDVVRLVRHSLQVERRR